MFKNKTEDGMRNVCGKVVATLRKEQGLSQRELADQLQLLGIDLNKNAISKLESGERFVTDIELRMLAKYFEVTADWLLGI